MPTVSAAWMDRYTSASSWGRLSRSILRPVSRSIRCSASLTTPRVLRREEVDLHETELLDVLLVVLGHDPVGHGRPLDRHEVDERRARDEHAADVDPQVARKAVDLAAQGEQPLPPVAGPLRRDFGAGRGTFLLRHHPRPPPLLDEHPRLRVDPRHRLPAARRPRGPVVARRPGAAAPPRPARPTGHIASSRSPRDERW